MEGFVKEVAFAMYCKKCENHDLEGFKEPCNSCLDVPAREGTSKPIKFVEAKKEVKHHG